MYRVIARFKKGIISRTFHSMYDAIEFKEAVEAHYPVSVVFEKGVYPVRTYIINSWDGVMNHNLNPLKNIPDLQTRHLVMQVLAWMWCVVFSTYFSSMWIFGLTAVAHILVIAAVVITVGTFTAASNNPSLFNLRPGYHSTSRSRQYMWVNGQKVKLDPTDPGGEHE
jgi:hypothetical protein